MKQTPLNQLATVSAGQAAPKDDEFSDRGIPFVRAGSLDSLLSGKSESDLELVSDETAKQRKLKTYPKGTILFAKSGMSATKDRIYVLQNPAYVVSHLATLIPNGNAHTEYLRLTLKRFPPSVLIKDPAYPAISLGDIQSYEIPVPDKSDDQIRIAYLLGKVEGLIAQRKQHLQQLDDLLKSVFLEMFGDPVRNEKGWEKRPIGSFAHVGTGSTPSRQKMAEYYGGLIPWVKTTEVQNCDIFRTDEHITELALRESNCSLYPIGTILLAMYGQGRTRGQAGYLKIEAATNQACAAILSSKHNQLFIFQQLRFLYDSIRALGRGGNQENLNLSLVRGIELLLPPKDIQDQFATIIEKIESIKSRYQQSLTELETLYGALSQQAFKGELDLSRVPLPSIKHEEEKVVVAEPLAAIAEQDIAINFPDTENMLDALENSDAREALIGQWLEAYRCQLRNTSFSVQNFMAAAQTRLAELHPETDFELGAKDYEHIKAWVFEALASNKLKQSLDEAGNRIQLVAAQ